MSTPQCHWGAIQSFLDHNILKLYMELILWIMNLLEVITKVFQVITLFTTFWANVWFKSVWVRIIVWSVRSACVYLYTLTYNWANLQWMIFSTSITPLCRYGSVGAYIGISVRHKTDRAWFCSHRQTNFWALSDWQRLKQQAVNQGRIINSQAR